MGCKERRWRGQGRERWRARCQLCILIFAALVTMVMGDDEPEANIAYFIQVSEATMTLLPRLLKSLWHPGNIYLIHFDKKIPQWQLDFSRKALLNMRFDGANASNVRILESEVITYRGISMVINTMNAMQAALEDAKYWDFFINISGSDYPLVSPLMQRKLLATSDFRSANRSFLTLAPVKWWGQSFQYRATRLFTDTSLAMNGSNSALIDSYKEHPLASMLGFRFVAAESWMILHNSFVRYLLTAPKARRYFAAFAYISEPEEHFFATVAWNTPQFNKSLIPDSMRQVIWTYKNKSAGQHPFNVDERDENGNWIFRNIVAKSGSFFTRKIKLMNSPFLDIIDAQFSGIAKDGVNETSVQLFLTQVRKRLKCIHPIREQGLVCDRDKKR